MYYTMMKKITKIGNSQGIVFDSALMELARLKPGDDVNIELHDGGTLTITPIRPRPSPAEVSKLIESTMNDYARTMKNLA